MSRAPDNRDPATGRASALPPLRAAGLVLLASLAPSAPVLAAGAGAVVLPARTTGEAIRLEGHPPGTRFDARGLVILSGKSEHFRLPAARFARLHDPARRPEAGIGYPDSNALRLLELPGRERYPLQLRGLRDPSLSGVTVIGQQSRDLPWRVVKAACDGDALHVKGCVGRADVRRVHWENVEDGFGPTGELESWSLADAYMRFIRDDAVENDDLVPGAITNCLIDGCFVFLSQRPDAPRRAAAITTTIRDCVVHVQAQPHDGETGRAWRDRNLRFDVDGIGRAPGMIFKWTEGAGRVHVENCVFRMDALSFNGPADMKFPPGHYEDVTLVWTGEGPYPQPLPPGVSLTRDLDAWRRARRAWIERLPSSHPSASRLAGPSRVAAFPSPVPLRP